MSTDTLADLFAELPPRLLARRRQLEDFQLGRLSETDEAKLRSDAEQDEDLDYALMLFEPFDATEMQGIEDLVQAVLPEVARVREPAPSLVLHEGGVPTPPVVTTVGRPRSRRSWYVGFAAAAAALIGVVATQTGPGFELQDSGVRLAEAGQQLRLELKPKLLRAAPEDVVVLAVAGDKVHRETLKFEAQGGARIHLAPVEKLAGRLAGDVQLLLVPASEAALDEELDAAQVKAMIARLGPGSSTHLRIQPPAYTLEARAEGTMLGGHDTATVTASTAVPVPGQLILNFRPKTRTGGDLDLRVLVSRAAGGREPLKAKIKALDGVYEVRAQGQDVFADQEDATVYLYVGPSGDPVPADEACAAPWRCTTHRVYRK